MDVRQAFLFFQIVLYSISTNPQFLTDRYERNTIFRRLNMVQAEKFCEKCGQFKMTTAPRVVIQGGAHVIKNICIGCEEEARLNTGDEMQDDY